jgi:hypothetical protein
MADELNKPSRGTGDWDIPLNQNFDTLEAAARAFLPRGTTQTLNVSDVNSDSITNSGTITSDSVKTQFLTDDYLFAEGFPGADPDARVNNALNAAGDGDVIYLENREYLKDLTVNNSVSIRGTGSSAGSRISGNLTLSAVGASVSEIRLAGTIETTESVIHISDINGFGNTGEITITAGNNILKGFAGVDVTLTSAASNVVVDSSVSTTVTDNGSNNKIGDIA